MAQRPIAFIGSRDTSQFPAEWLALYDEAAERCARNGFPVRTGAAVNSDQRAAECALRVGGTVQLVLPWRSYEEEWVDRMTRTYPGRVTVTTYDPRDPEHEPWTRSVHEYHPVANVLTRGVFALQARNYGIVAPTIYVIALPGLLKEGGTGQGLRIARGLEIPAFNLTTDYGRAELQARFRKRS